MPSGEKAEHETGFTVDDKEVDDEEDDDRFGLFPLVPWFMQPAANVEREIPEDCDVFAAPEFWNCDECDSVTLESNPDDEDNEVDVRGGDDEEE